MLQSKSLLGITALSLLLTVGTATAGKKNVVVDAPAFNKLAIEKLTSPRTLLASFALASAYSLYSRLPVPEDKWESRFDFKTFTSPHKIATKEYWQNLWHLYQDKWVGQCYKSKSVRIGGDRLQIRKKDCYPHGVCGTIDATLKTISKSADGLSSLILTYFLINQYGVLGLIQPKLTASAKDAPSNPAIASGILN